MSELTALTVRRGQLKAQLTRLATYLRENVDYDIDQIKLRAEKAREIWDDFQLVEAQIEEQEGANDDTEKYRSEFEDLFYTNLAKCENLLRASIERNTSATSNGVTSNASASISNSVTPMQSAVKLAALQIPEFSGVYTEWASFYDIFSALVHENESLSDIQKFFYLRSSLTGDAENVIKCFQTTASNYRLAWESLIIRYDNKKVLIQVHTQSIFELERIKKESAVQLRKLVDALNGHMKALESLGESPNQWGSLLLYLITSKLDEKTMRKWEIVSSKIEMSSVTELINFLQTRFRILEAVESSKQINSNQENNYRKSTAAPRKIAPKSHSFAATGQIKCFLCRQAHTIYRCPSLLNLSISDRIKKITELKLCKICLRKTHEREKCPARPCPICARPHNGLLHLPRASPDKNDDFSAPSTSSSNMITDKKDDDNITAASVSLNVYARNENNHSQILLSTATVLAYNYDQKPVLCRVLLDSGSQHNFMTESLAQLLRLKRTKTSCTVVGINESAHKASYSVSTTIKSRINDFFANLNFFVLPRLTNTIPLMPIDLSILNLPADLALADPSFGTPQAIDMLLGAEIFFDLIINNQLRPVAHGPVMQNTHLGWIIAGPVPRIANVYKDSSISLFTHNLVERSDKLEDQMAAFWRLEEVKHDYACTLEERACKLHFEKNVQRDNNGRFIVSLPFRDAPKLGKSYDTALRRFLALERRFQSNKNLKAGYIKFMQEYHALGHMSLAQPDVMQDHYYYMPHHAVFKESSTTTKLRVVFDASSKTDNGLSLNDVLLKGPCIQEELVSIMSRFRTYKYVLTADIKKMYRQIWISENQRDYQRILWRENPDQPVNIYTLKTVTYGVITASYLATACLKKLSENEVETYPEACRALSEDFYVDDFLGGAATLTKALKLRDDLITVLKGAGMELCKWSSNEPKLLSDVGTSPNNDKQDSLSDSQDVTKVLGLYWNQVNDAYQYKVSPYIENAPVTKRKILAEIASIFDPLGLISPVIIRFKIIMQKLWQLKTDWDGPLPSNIEREWRDSRKTLMNLNLLAIKRSIIGDGEPVNVQLHGFADASMMAYGACLYLRVLDSNGECISNLVCSKSRVAPLKTISIPRLELLAAVLLSRLASKIASLRLPNVKIFYWSDSTVALAWIASQSARWKTFVANRVGEIHERTSIDQWHHVSTQDNPADIVSRGCDPGQIKNLKLWWNGPVWLSTERAGWPKIDFINYENDEILAEEKKLSHVACASQCDLSFLDRYSSLFKLLRVISYCRRFKHNALSSTDRIFGPIRVSEINETTICIIKQIQRVSFERECFDLRNSRSVHNKSALLRLKPFIDENGLIRVGGRLTNASTLNVSQRHPIILPAKCMFTKLIFLHEHQSSLHGGPQAMLASIRLKYWPLNGRNIARSVARSCVKCFKYRPVVLQPIMGDLPKSRVEPARAFIKAGVDFAGPFRVKAGLRRNAPITKTYACIWVCLSTKAVHIELVGDLTTQSFLSALQRFCDRRGLCTDIYSDNATNFVGANRQLQELRSLFLSEDHQERVQNTLSKKGIQWHFIPPRSPHFGGLWEAAVKSLKSHLYKTMGNAALTFEELNTLLVRVEAILNSRPLTPLSTDPSDLSVLTPAHFLIGDSLCALPDRDETVTPENRLSRWRRVVQVSQHLWSRWSREYLGQLQERSKWSRSRSLGLQVGTVVLVKDDHLPPLQWSIGRVITTHRGTDNQVRVATIKTCGGEFKRAVRNLCPLPFEGNQPNYI